jgi:hypothetical protein
MVKKIYLYLIKKSFAIATIGEIFFLGVASKTSEKRLTDLSSKKRSS